MSNETNVTIDRRKSEEKYKKNPFLAEAVAEVKIGYKTMTFGTGETVSNTETGELIGTAAFRQRKVVDQSKFLMLYEKMQAFFWQLSPRANKLLRVIYHQAQEAIATDEIYLNWDIAEEILKSESIKMSKATYFRAVKELLEKKVLAQSVRTNIFYLNPTLIFNGNRASFIQEIISEDPSIEDEAYKLIAKRALDAHRNISSNELNIIGNEVKDKIEGK